MALRFFDQGGGRDTPTPVLSTTIFPIDSRAVPLLLSGSLLLVQVAFGMLRKFASRGRREREVPGGPSSRLDAEEMQHNGLRSKIKHIVDIRGGCTIVAFTIAQVLGTLSLLYLSATTSKRDCANDAGGIFSKLCPQDCLTIAFVIASASIAISLCPHPQWLLPAQIHITTLISAFLVYVYRDIWPLATNYGQAPADYLEGQILWVKISLLFVLAVILPLLIPHLYIPVDPKNPTHEPNPEQTASWISLLTFSFVDPLIRTANKVPHLRHDQLPPLADYDSASYLTTTVSKYTDPFPGKKRHHLFFLLLNSFRREFMTSGGCLLLVSAFSFAAPIGINRTLSHLETRQHDNRMTVKPWVWISLMLFGPILQATFNHWNLFVQSKVRVRIQAVLTHLIFEHSLRIRMKAGASTAEGAKTVSSDTEYLVGRINNLLTSDLENIVEGCDFLSLVIYVPVQITLSVIFLLKVLGWSAVVGLFVTVALVPIPGYLSKLLQKAQVTKMKLTDARVQAIIEAMSVSRMIKLFGWEAKMTKRIETKREEELASLWKIKKLKLSNKLISMFIPTLAMLVTYAVYTVFMKEALSASKIFSSMSVFTILREQLGRIVWYLSSIVEANVSLDRANSFLQDTELLDIFAIGDPEPLPGRAISAVHEPSGSVTEIGFKNATFSWSLADSYDSLTPPSRNFKLHVNGELFFKKNAINLIIGPTGSGKTSMLLALLGEMHFIPNHADSWFNLPRQGGVAYAAQESWVQNATIKDNIVFFGSSFDKERYNKVIRQCALEHDLEMFDAGDETEVGESGLTLSGGQKARITLARAIYSSAEILLLDDIFASLDVQTSAWIVEHCFLGDLVRDRTVILATHSIALARSIADSVVSLGIDGSIQIHDKKSIKTELTDDSNKVQDISPPERNTPEAKSTAQEPKDDNKPLPLTTAHGGSAGKLVMAEEIVQGHITFQSIKLLLVGLGGKYPIIFAANWFGGMLLSQLFRIIQPWFLGVWGSQYKNRPPSEVNLRFYLSVFTAIVFSRLVSFATLNFYFNYRSIDASRMIHLELLKSIFRSTLRWMDKTPTARIISRFTQDIRAVDDPIPQSLMWLADQSLGMVSTLGTIVLFAPVFLLPSIGVAALGVYIGKRYLKAQLSIKREMSNARSPVLAHFGAAIHGLVSIRAYGTQKSFKHEGLKRIDHYSRIARASGCVSNWVGFRIDTIGAVFTASLAFYLVYGRDDNKNNAGNAGFLLNLAVIFCNYIFWLVKGFNDFEIAANSLERIQGYIDIEHEPEPSSLGHSPPAAWPTSGDLRVEGLSARYSQTSPEVLHDLTFHIAPGEHIGIVGRTGSGKSTLILSLLRCIPTDGKVFYDGIDTSTINLETLRSNVSIIPQTPELLSGTLRQNLDPFQQNDDATLNDALHSAGLSTFSLQESSSGDSFASSHSRTHGASASASAAAAAAGDSEPGRPMFTITLDTQISGGGGGGGGKGNEYNLSVGQRQIVALARAIVRGCKVLILDEATSALDYTTDAMIQNTLRTAIRADMSVITIAHRLHTVMDYDKIMVLENGKIVEFDAPDVLLKNENGVLRAMVDGIVDDDDRALLYALVSKKIKK